MAKKVEGDVFDKFNSALYIWFRQEREKGCPVTDPILLEKSSKFHHLISINTQGPFQQVLGFNGGFAGDLTCVILKYVAKNYVQIAQLLIKFSVITGAILNTIFLTGMKPDCIPECCLDIS